MLRDQRKWEKFQKAVSWILLACALGFLVVIFGMRRSPKNSIFGSAFLISGFLLLGVTIVILLMIMVVLVILDVREWGAKQTAARFIKSFFVYLGAAVLVVLMMQLWKNTLFQKGTVREIWLFAIALDAGSYLGKFTKRRLPNE